MSGLVGRRIATGLEVCVAMELCVGKGGRERSRDRVFMDVVGRGVRLLFMFGRLRFLHRISG
jgi:hypothetical protein